MIAPRAISEHFSIAELTRTQVRPAIGVAGPWNAPDDTQTDALIYLCHTILEPVRMYFNRPVIVHSGFRSEAVNLIVGGQRNSQHCRGEAADIEVLGVSNADVARFIIANLPYDQLIAEHWSDADPSAGWVHVSAVDGGRREVLTIDANGTRAGLPVRA